MYYVIGFLILFGALVLVHEFGHLVVAKLFGVKVLKFSLGFPPALIKRTWGETEYMLSWIPLGGYVKLMGEDPESSEEIPPGEEDRAYSNKSLLAQIAIIAAGPLANYLCAVILLCLGCATGWPVLVTEIGKVLEGSPAAEAGFRSGDIVTAIDGQEVWRWDDMRTVIEKSTGKALRMTVKQGSETKDITVTPKSSDQKDFWGQPLGRIGVTPSGKTVKLSVAKGLYEGLRYSGHFTKFSFLTLEKLIRFEIRVSALGGPISWAQASGEYLKIGIPSFVFFLSYVSIYIAIFNLLPIPPLDGGHLLFLLIEAIIRRPVSSQIVKGAVKAGFALIIFLLVLALYADIYRIVTKGWNMLP